MNATRQEGRPLRIILATVLSSAFLACASAIQPYKTSAIVSGTTAEAVYKCAIGKVTDLGYTLEHVSKESGFFRAEKTAVAGPSSIHWGAQITSELTILVVEDGPRLQVTASSGANTMRNERMVSTSKEAQSHADAVIQACGAVLRAVEP